MAVSVLLVLPGFAGWVGVEPGGRGLVGGLAHCWVLKDQATESSGPPWLVSCLCGAGSGLVGLLFEICIVDASILHRRPAFPGVWCLHRARWWHVSVAGCAVCVFVVVVVVLCL